MAYNIIVLSTQKVTSCMDCVDLYVLSLKMPTFAQNIRIMSGLIQFYSGMDHFWISTRMLSSRNLIVEQA